MSGVPLSWQPVVGEETKKPYFLKLIKFLSEERQSHTVYPPEPEVFAALETTPYDQVKVFLLGQDPYHDANQAHGLCFSVRPGVKPPRPSSTFLRNSGTTLAAAYRIMAALSHGRSREC